VRWNAALALARLGSDAGKEVLIQMLDREKLTAQGMSDLESETVMINAVKGLALINKEDTRRILAEISKNDKSLKVRQAALNAVQQEKKP
jgi:HEAT repeat protein